MACQRRANVRWPATCSTAFPDVLARAARALRWTSACWSSAAVIRHSTPCSIWRSLSSERRAPRSHGRYGAATLSQLYGGGASDALPARGQLGARAFRQIVDSGLVQIVTGFRATLAQSTPDGIVVSSDTQALPPVDEVIVATGFRPDLSLTSELRLALDPARRKPGRACATDRPKCA